MKKQSVSIFIHLTVFSKVLNTLIISRLFSVEFLEILKLSIFNSSYFYYLPFVNLRKNLEKMKKAFCFDYFSMSRPESKFFHVWFEFFPSYLSRKKEISETFLGLGLRSRPQKTFPRFPFFYFSNMGKRKNLTSDMTWKKIKTKYCLVQFF